jgi:hypothetical protein
MKVVTDENVFPPRKHFVDVDPKFTNFTPRVRVLPANYFEDPHNSFTLKAVYQPGENKYFPKGGMEVYHSEGAVYSYYLDEVIVHPYVLGMRKFFTKSENVVKEKVSTGTPGKRGRPKKDGELKTKAVYVPTGGSRGRKPMDPALKAVKDAEKAERAKNSNGRRGRPSKAKI